MRDISAFIDEFGNTNIDTEKSGVSTYFILTAVLLTSSEVGTTRQKVDAIRQRLFQTGEMKSSKIGKDDEKRFKVLEALNTLDLKSYSVAVDKRELSKESGLVHKKSFFKYINHLLYERLYRSFENIDVVADEHGYEEFMRGFKLYLNRKLRPNLFASRTFTFMRSVDEPLLQVADIISGTLARSLEPDMISPQSQDLQKLVAKNSIGITIWPPRSLPKPQGLRQDKSSGYDDLIRDHCIRAAEAFLERTSREDEETRIQVEVLEYLLFNVLFVDSSAFLSTGKIINHLRHNVGLEMNDYRLRGEGIAPLRDANVIIASSTKGYKIPVCAADIAKFVEHANTIIPPMLARLNRAREELMLVSLGELDILDADEYLYLRSLSDFKIQKTE